MPDVTLKAIDAYLLDCFAEETPPRVSELAERMGLSRTQLSDVFADRFRVRPSVYLKRKQVAFATELLRTTNLPSAKVAYRAGFGTRRTMFRAFRRVAQATPRDVASDEMSLATSGRRL